MEGLAHVLWPVAKAAGTALAAKVFGEAGTVVVEKARGQLGVAPSELACGAALGRAIYEFHVRDRNGWADAIFPNGQPSRDEVLVAELRKRLTRDLSPDEDRIADEWVSIRFPPLDRAEHAVQHESARAAVHLFLDVYATALGDSIASRDPTLRAIMDSRAVETGVQQRERQIELLDEIRDRLPSPAASTDLDALIRASVRQYLELVALRARETPSFVGDRVTFGQIRQRVRVSDERLPYRQGTPDADTNRIYRRRDAEEYEAALGHPPIDWEGVRATPRVVVLGDPGFGKSWLLKAEALRAAEAATARLLAADTDLDSLEVPVLLSLALVAEHIQSGVTPDAVLLAALQSRYLLPGGWPYEFREWMRQYLLRAGCVLLFDGLDEVPASSRGPLGGLLESIAETSSARVVVTSRIAGYSSPPFPHAKEFELTAFDTPAVHSFIAAWFVETPARADALTRELSRVPMLDGLSRTPLLLAFLCLIAADTPAGEPLPLRRSELYARVLRLLLQAPWRHDHARLDDEQLDARVQLLGEVTYELAVSDRAWRDLFHTRELRHTISKLAPDAGVVPLEPGNGLLWELAVRDGLLVAAGAGGPGRDVPYLFVHRTVQEYLLAAALSERPDAEWQAWVRQHAVVEPNMSETIVLLAGCVRDPSALLRCLLAIGEAGEDAFHRAHRLATQALSEIPSADARWPELVHDVVWGTFARAVLHPTGPWMDALVATGSPAVGDLLRGVTDADPEIASAALAALGRIGDTRAISNVRGALEHRAPQVRHAARLALERIEGIQDEPADPMANWAAGKRLVERLADSDWTIRRDAVDALGVTRDKRAVPVLLTALRDPEPLVAYSAVLAAASIGGEDVVDGLLRALSDREVSNQGEIVAALGDLADVRAVPTLVSVVSTKPAIAPRAIEALGKLGDPRAVNVLVSGLRERRYLYEYGLIARALGQIGDKRAVDGLLDLLSNPSAGTRGAAVDALASIGDKRSVPSLVRVLEGDEEAIASRAARALGTLGGAQAADALVQVLSTSDSIVLQWEAAESLSRLGDARAIDALIRLLDTSAPYAWPNLTEALGRIDDPRATDALARACGHLDEEVRAEAIRGLARTHDERQVDLIVTKLDDATPSVRTAALDALATIGGTRSFDAVIHAFEAGRLTGFELVEAIERIGDPRGVDVLVQLLPTSAELCAMSLSTLGGLQALDGLLEGSSSSDPDMRAHCAKALANWTDLSAIAELSAMQLVAIVINGIDRLQRDAVRLLASRRDPAAIVSLIEALNHSSPRIQERVAIALGQLGDRRAAEALVRAIESDDDGVRWAAVEALETLRTPAATPALLRALTSPEADVRRAAARALGASIDALTLATLLAEDPIFADAPVSVGTALLQSLTFSFWDRSLEERRALANPVAGLSDLDLAESLEPMPTFRTLARSLYARVASQYPHNTAAANGLVRLGG
jgi:HEAT repeat protein